MAENLTNLASNVVSATSLVTNLLDTDIPNVPDVPNPEDLVPDIPNIPDVPNPEDLVPELPDVPEVPELPDFGGLIGGLPLPSFRKPQPVKVEKPPEPRKLQQQSKIPNVPKKPELPKVPNLPNPPGIPPEYRKVIGGRLFDVTREQGGVAYIKDIGFGQYSIYRLDSETKQVIGPYTTTVPGETV